MLHVHGKYVVRGSQWVGRGSNAGGLGLSCRWAGAVILKNHNFDQFCIIVSFCIMNQPQDGWAHSLKESLCKQLKHEKMNNDIVHLKADTLFIITSVLQSNLKNVAKMCLCCCFIQSEFHDHI